MRGRLRERLPGAGAADEVAGATAGREAGAAPGQRMAGVAAGRHVAGAVATRGEVGAAHHDVGGAATRRKLADAAADRRVSRGAAGRGRAAARFVVAGAAVLLGLAGCERRDPAELTTSLEALRQDVRVLGDSAAARFVPAIPPLATGPDTAHVAVGLRLATLSELVRVAAARYLHDVRLHLDLDVVVRAGDEVRVRVGPVNALAGRWDLVVTVQRVDALLQAGAIQLAPGDSNRLDLLVPVEVRDGTGQALIEFEWEPVGVAGMLCGPFRVHEQFTGYVDPHTHEMRGHIDVVMTGGRMVARPTALDRVFVSPRPTEESWARLREILREQDRIFNCGLALSPERMERMLEELFERGFRFSLPSSVLRPIPLPGEVLNEVAVAGRRVAVAVRPEPPRIVDDRLWLRALVQPEAVNEGIIQLGDRAASELSPGR